MNEQDLCQKRLLDLSRQADRKGIVLFSDFLNLNELNIYHQSEKLFATRTECFGGIPCAERQMIAFLPDALYYDWEYPISALKITPAYPKFAEKLGHRDILGSLMQLGIDRCKLGDILVGEQEAYLLCEETVADYFAEHLEKIRHTLVKVEPCSLCDLKITQEFQSQDGIVTSDRIDAVIACVYHLSRSQASLLLRQEKVFVSGKLMQNPSYTCHADDIISLYLPRGIRDDRKGTAQNTLRPLCKLKGVFHGKIDSGKSKRQYHLSY